MTYDTYGVISLVIIESRRFNYRYSHWCSHCISWQPRLSGIIHCCNMAQHWQVSMPGSCKCRAVFTNGVALMSRTWEISYKEPVLGIYVLYTMIILHKRPGEIPLCNIYRIRQENELPFSTLKRSTELAISSVYKRLNPSLLSLSRISLPSPAIFIIYLWHLVAIWLCIEH